MEFLLVLPACTCRLVSVLQPYITFIMYYLIWTSCLYCRLVSVLQSYITLTLYQQQAITEGVEQATR